MRRGAEGPWYVTITAMEQYLRLRGVDPDRATRDQQEDAITELLDMAEDTLSSVRVPTVTDSGMLRYRGPAPERLTLVVSQIPRVEGGLPQLVAVISPRPVKQWRQQSK